MRERGKYAIIFNSCNIFLSTTQHSFAFHCCVHHDETISSLRLHLLSLFWAFHFYLMSKNRNLMSSIKNDFKGTLCDNSWICKRRKSQILVIRRSSNELLIHKQCHNGARDVHRYYVKAVTFRKVNKNSWHHKKLEFMSWFVQHKEEANCVWVDFRGHKREVSSLSKSSII